MSYFAVFNVGSGICDGPAHRFCVIKIVTFKGGHLMV